MTQSMPLRTASVLALAACLALPPVLAPAQDAAPEPPRDFTAIVAELSPAVVGIRARGVRDDRPMMPEGGPFGRPGPFGMPGPFGAVPGQQPPAREVVAGGSGFMVSADGHIVTNNHVVEGATAIEIRLSDGTMRDAELVGTDPATDIAVLRVTDTEGIAVASWGDSDAMRPGAWTIAIGSPFGLGGTVTVGVLSATSRVIGAGPYDAFLQTDASINSGNSGGPLFNTAGEVIGVNTAIFSPGGGNVGIGFAVPSSIAEDVVRQLIETGTVERGFIGVSLQPVDDSLARALGLDAAEGAIVARVEPGAPAEAAGIEAGDVILSVDGEAAGDPRQISRSVAGLSPGTEVPVTVFRDGERIEVTLTLAQRDAPDGPAEAAPEETGARMGVAVAPVPELMRRSLGLAADEAVAVQSVQPGSPAAQAGLRQGDVILSAAGDGVASAETLSSAWAEAREAGRPLLLQVSREGNPMFLAVEPREG